MPPCIAALDVGTTSVKACLFTPELELIACCVQEYALDARGGWVEARPETYLAAARDAMRAALAAGVDSIEHGAYLSPETRSQLAESHAVWVPTLVTIGNLIGDGRFPDAALLPLLAFQQRSVRDAAAQGARIACGSDAGAYRVLHAQGGLDEQALLRRTLGPIADQILTQGNTEIQKRF